MLKSSALRVPAIVAMTLWVPVAAAAQASGEVRRPYRGLFGGDPYDATLSSLTVNLSGMYDDNILPQRGNGPVDPRFQKKGYMGGGQAALSIQRGGERVGFSLQATTSFRYYAEQGELLSESHGLFATASVRPKGRTSFNVGGGVAYSPMYSGFLTPTGTPGEIGIDPPGITTSSGDYAVSFRPALMMNGSAEISRSFSRRLSLNAGYATTHLDYVDEDTEQRRDSAYAGASYRITRYSSLRVGYSHAEYLLGENIGTRTFHDIQGGVDYRRPLSLSGKRTMFTVTPGWTVAELDGRLQVHAAARVTLDHEIGRTWSARANYQRGIRFIDGLQSEMLANSVTAQVGGLLNRRTQLSFGGQLTLGEKSTAAGDYQAYVGAARVSYAMTRQLAAYAHYLYFHYRFGESVTLPDNVAGRMDRQGVRVGITLWVPVLR